MGGGELITNIDFYKFEREIGKGSFGKVCLGIHKLTGLKVAIKIFRRKELEECDHTRHKIM
jgi:serine/threonine protein kinase